VPTRIRRPEYTGENRCVPCTVLNIIIAAGAAGVLTVLFGTPLGVVSFVVSSTAIYVRGYLVPGTPTLTKTYVPETLLRPFGEYSSVERPVRAGETTSCFESEYVLFAAGVVEYQEHDVCLTPEFQQEWDERIRTIRERGLEQADVLEAFDADTVSRHGQLSFVIDTNELHRWASEAALIADVAAARELSAKSTDWSSFGVSKRADVLTGLRLLLQHCPCDGPLSTTKDHVDPCCQKSYTDVESTCRDCGATIVAVTVPDTDNNRPIQTRFFES
jgi:hypothetical protein